MRRGIAAMEYPFECFLAAYGTLGAVLVLSGGGLTDSIRSVVPPTVVVIWALVLGLASLTLAAGLARIGLRVLLPAGLRLLAIAFGALAIAAVILEPRTWVADAFLLFIGSLAGLRSYYLRAITRARFQARQEQ